MPMDADSRSSDPTPVTIIAGFLGAGKTTLLNRILSNTRSLRTAVLVNDFGALNIDAQLIVGVESRGIINLANGCICCTIQDDLLAVTLNLLRRSDPPDSIVVEASGVSNPFAILQAFMLPDLLPILSLDGVITVVDAEQFGQLSGEYAALAYQQVAAADIVVVNKTDLVNATQREALRAKLAAVQPRIFETTYGQAPVELLVGIGHDTVDQLFAYWPDSGEHEESEAHAHEHSAHDTLFSAWHWSSSRLLSGKAVRRALRTLPAGILRAKGILYVQENPDRRMILQVVGSRVSWTVGEAWGSATPYSQLVAIGMPESFDHAALTELLDSAVIALNR